MSSVIRDFSQEAVANIRELIRENVDEEKQFFLWDWIDDSFKMDDLNIQDYLNDVSKYQSHMVDKHNINSKKFDRILERVKAVDVNYAKRFNEIYESVVSYNNKILKVTNMISPEGMTLKRDVYDSVIDGIERIHNKDIDYLKYDLKDYDDELPVLRDIPWYEKALNAVGGTAVSLIRDNVEGLCFIPYAIVDGMFGTNLNERLQNCLDDAEEYLINNVVTDEQFYYYGKTVGNVICMVEGAIFIANGLTTIVGGITLLGGGVALSSTGVGAIFGGAAIAVSIPAVAAGAIAISSGGGIMYSSMNNFEENLSKAQEAQTSEVDEVKLKDDIKELDGKIDESGITTIKKQIRHIQTKTPEELILEGWEDVTNPKMAANTTSRELYNHKTGLKIRFDKGVEGANGFEGVDHYHILNNNYTNKKVDYYFDIDGNPVGKGSRSSHIVIKGD